MGVRVKSPNAPVTSGALQFQFPPVSSMMNKTSAAGPPQQQLPMNPPAVVTLQQPPKGTICFAKLHPTKKKSVTRRILTDVDQV